MNKCSFLLNTSIRCLRRGQIRKSPLAPLKKGEYGSKPISKLLLLGCIKCEINFPLDKGSCRGMRTRRGGVKKLAFYILLLIFFSLSTNPTQAQEKFRSFNLGVGYTLPKFLDNSFSALRYQGHAGTVAGGFHFRKDSSTLEHIDLRFDYGQLSAFAFEFADVNYFRIEGNYSYNKRVKDIWQNRLQWFIGGSINSLYTLWDFSGFSNNSFNTSFYLSLSPNSSLVYPFKLWNRQFRAEYSAYLPLLTFAVRPSYGTTRLSGFLDDERDEPIVQFFESGAITSLNKFFRFSNTWSLEYFLSNRNRLRLSYEWNYLRYSEPRLVKAASHNIVIGTMFNF